MLYPGLSPPPPQRRQQKVPGTRGSEGCEACSRVIGGNLERMNCSFVPWANSMTGTCWTVKLSWERERERRNEKGKKREGERERGKTR